VVAIDVSRRPPMQAEGPLDLMGPSFLEAAELLARERGSGTGFTVRVIAPDEGTEALGWRVLVDSPGQHTSFRIRRDAAASEWVGAVDEIVRRSN